MSRVTNVISFGSFALFGPFPVVSVNLGTIVHGEVMPVVALVVDDSMLIRHTVCRFLEERGFAVESATNGLEALEVLKRVRPDILITDIQMPKMSGTELITAVKYSDRDRRGKTERLRAHGKARRLHHIQRHRYRGSTSQGAPGALGHAKQHLAFSTQPSAWILKCRGSQC
jgi:CheY-like chemotaxis protein